MIPKTKQPKDIAISAGLIKTPDMRRFRIAHAHKKLHLYSSLPNLHSH